MPFPLPPYPFGNRAAMGGGAAASGPLFVQQAVATAADGSAGVTATFPVPVTAGNSVIACISLVDEEFNDNPVMTGGAAGGLTTAAAIALAGLSDFVYYIHGLNSSETGVTFSVVNATRASIQISEFSGLANAVPVVNSNSGTSNTVTTGSVTPATASNLVVGMAASVNATSNFSTGPTNSFTAMTSTGGASLFQRSAYLIQVAANAKSTGYGLSSSTDWVAAIAAFRGA